MRVVCPACAATYEVPAPVVEARRTLRCTGCGLQFPAAPSPTERPVQVPRPAIPERSSGHTEAEAPGEEIRASEAGRLATSGAAARAPRVRAAVLAGWVASLVLLGASAGAAVTWRQPIMRAWPPSTRAYAALGYAH